MTEISNPFEMFLGLDGKALNNGKIYIGIEDGDPQTNQIAVFWDVGLTIPATQPLRTIGGYISNAGSIASAYVSEAAYSIRVLTSTNSLVFYDASSTGSSGGGGGGGDANVVYVADYGWTNSGSLVTADDIAANPQWIGKPTLDATYKYPLATTTPWVAGVDMIDNVALQEAIYAACAGTSTVGHIVTNQSINQSNLNRPLKLPKGSTYVGWPLFMSGSGLTIEGYGRTTTSLFFVVDPTYSGWWQDSVSYSVFRGFSVVSNRSNQQAVIEADYTGAFVGLKTQANSWYDVLIASGARVQRGLRYNRIAGGSGQGSEITYENTHWAGFDVAGVELNGFNCINHAFIGGDAQGNNCDFIVVNGGSANVYSMSFENQGTFGHVTTPCMVQTNTGGADFHVISQAGYAAISSIASVRSESDVGVISLYPTPVTNMEVNGSGIAGVYLSYPFHRGEVLLGTDGRNYKIVDEGASASGTARGTLDFFVAAPAIQGQTLTVIPRPVGEPAWTVNQFQGRVFQMRYGSNGYTIEIDILSNTANDITLSSAVTIASGGDTMWKIGGRSGASAPTWSSIAAGRKIVGGVLQGFSTVAGSNIVTVPGTPYDAAVGDYIEIIRGDVITSGENTMVVNYQGRIVAKLTAPQRFQMDRPVAFTFTDAVGYTFTPTQWGDLQIVEYPNSVIETMGAVIDCRGDKGLLRSAAYVRGWYGRPPVSLSITDSYNYLGPPAVQRYPALSANTFDLSLPFQSRSGPWYFELTVSAAHNFTCSVVQPLGSEITVMVKNPTGGSLSTSAMGTGVKTFAATATGASERRAYTFVSDGTVMTAKSIGPSSTL